MQQHFGLADDCLGCLLVDFVKQLHLELLSIIQRKRRPWLLLSEDDLLEILKKESIFVCFMSDYNTFLSHNLFIIIVEWKNIV
jgi:hypothetical protein